MLKNETVFCNKFHLKLCKSFNTLLLGLYRIYFLNNCLIAYFIVAINQTYLIMKSRLLLFIVCFIYSFGVIAQTQYTAIPDSNFELALTDYDDIPNDNQVPTANINSITLLDVGGMNISDLTGVEDFVSLTVLGCYDNQLTSIDISNNTSLVYFFAYNNQFTSIDVSNNKDLTYLYINENQLTSLDVSLNTNLAVLHCHYNMLTTIDVSQNSNLNVLRCGHNFLTNVDVSQNLALTELLADESDLQSLDLSANTALTRLYCNSCNLSSLNVKNGNNYNMDSDWFRIKTNPDLLCVEVDDADYSTANWTKIDDQTMFNENCGESLSSEYVIIAEERVVLKFNSDVLSGSVGVINEDGQARVRKFSQVAESVEASEIIVDNTSSVGTEVLEPADIDLPDFIYNIVSNQSSPDVVVNNYQTVILDGSEYGRVFVKYGGAVTFTNSNVYLEELKMQNSTTIDFEECTNLYIKDKIKFGKNTRFNPSENSVFVYVDGKVEVDRGSDITASIYANNSILKAKSRFWNQTHMKGLFIGRRVKGERSVMWNKDDSLMPCNVSDESMARKKVGKDKIKTDLSVQIEEAKIITEGFNVKTWPIPSSNNFNVRVHGLNASDIVSINVYDINGRLVHKNEFNSRNQYSFGENLQSGIYVVKIAQDSNIKTVRVIKN